MKTMAVDDSGNDIHPALALADGSDSVAQRIRQKLRLSQGEWFMDAEAGTPWFDVILARGVPDTLVEATLVHSIREVEGVENVTGITIERDADRTRTASVSVTVETYGGDEVEASN